jgi:hypothetical protein
VPPTVAPVSLPANYRGRAEDESWNFLRGVDQDSFRDDGSQRKGTPGRNAEETFAEAVGSLINATHAEVVWVGLGARKQARWMFEHQSRLNVPVLVGVGSAWLGLAWLGLQGAQLPLLAPAYGPCENACANGCARVSISYSHSSLALSSRGLGHRPLKAETRVRIPLALPFSNPGGGLSGRRILSRRDTVSADLDTAARFTYQALSPC